MPSVSSELLSDRLLMKGDVSVSMGTATMSDRERERDGHDTVNDEQLWSLLEDRLKSCMTFSYVGEQGEIKHVLPTNF